MITKKQAEILLWVLNGYNPPQPDARFLHDLVDGKNEKDLLDRAYKILQKISGSQEKRK